MDHLNSLMGSVHYMAPEQFQRLPLDQRTDLYSLGCIFYEAVTGHPAFDGANVSELIDAHLKHEPFSMKYLRQDLSLELERWIDRLLEKDPAHRTASAAAALATLPSLAACTPRQAPQHAPPFCQVSPLGGRGIGLTFLRWDVT